MMKKPTNITDDQIKKYLENQFDDHERHLFEKELQKDEFLSEALEGLKMLKPEELDTDLKLLMSGTDSKNKNVYLRYWVAAASVLIFILTGTVLIISKRHYTPPVMVENKTELQPETDLVPGTSHPVAGIRKEEKIGEKKLPELKETTATNGKKSMNLREGPETMPGKQAKAGNENTDLLQFAEEKETGDSLADKVQVVEEPRLVTGVVAGKTETGTEVPAAPSIPMLAEKMKIRGKNIYLNATGKAEPAEAVADRSRGIKKKSESKDSLLLPEITYVFPTNAEKFSMPVNGFSEYFRSLGLDSLKAEYKNMPVEIEIRITKKGKIGGIRFLNILESSGIRTVKNKILEGPSWTPAVSEGKPVESVIKFRIKTR
jgi:hypothetical protein